MNQEERLRVLRERMSPTQRQDMGDIIQAELKRRATEKQGLGAKSTVGKSMVSTNLDESQLGEMYGEVNEKIAEFRRRKVEKKLAEINKMKKEAGGLTARKRFAGALEHVSFSKMLIVFGIISLAGAKFAFSSGLLEEKRTLAQSGAAIEAPSAKASSQARARLDGSRVENDIQPVQLQRPGMSFNNISWVEKELLTKLDRRRVELENRKALLDKREARIETKMKLLRERLAELHTISNKIEQSRAEHAHRDEARIEQLANVYGSMPPKEAAPLIANLDDDISIGLLQRMPGKRVGQILSTMTQKRAIELTKILSDRNKFNR